MTFRFLDLPAEIRQRIYILLVSSERAINLSPNWSATERKLSLSHLLSRTYPAHEPPAPIHPLYPTFPSALLLTCVQIHQELSPVYFTHNTFTLTIRKHNDNYATILAPDSPFRTNLLTIKTLRLIILRFGSKNYFAGIVVPILEECILTGKLRNLEVWVKDQTCYSSQRLDHTRAYQIGGGMGGGNGGPKTEYDNWNSLRRLCGDPWLKKVSLKAGFLEEDNGEIVQSCWECENVPFL